MLSTCLVHREPRAGDGSRVGANRRWPVHGAGVLGVLIIHLMPMRHNDKNDIAKKGVVNALAAFIYVAAVVLFMSAIQQPDVSDAPVMRILAPLGFLMLFVLSAAVVGLLVFGAPVMRYMDCKKKEAVQLLAWTIGSLTVITVCVLAVVTLVAAR